MAESENVQENGTSIKSLSRVADYPVLKDSYSKASEYYQWIKGQNSTLNSTLTWSENQLKVVINKVEPIAASKLHSVDEYACSKLDTLEEKCPIVKEPTEIVLNNAQEYYNSNIKLSLVHAKDSALFIASTPLRLTTNTLYYLAATANNFVGNYLSPKSDSTDTSGEQHEAIYSKAMKEIMLIKQYTLNNAEHLQKLLDSKVKQNKEWLQTCYKEYLDEFSKKEGDSTDDKEKVDDDAQINKLAVSYADKLRLSLRAMSTVCYHHLPEDKQKKMDEMFAKSEQLYSNLTNLKMSDINMTNVNYIKDTSVSVMKDMTNYIFGKYKENTGKEPIEITEESGDGDHEKVE